MKTYLIFTVILFIAIAGPDINRDFEALVTRNVTRSG